MKKFVIIKCNKCDQRIEVIMEFDSIEFFNGVARDLSFRSCPRCYIFDQHYIFEKDQICEA